ncbi:MAG: hypothetical protein ACK4MG_15705 [Aquabacterium sp.]
MTLSARTMPTRNACPPLPPGSVRRSAPAGAAGTASPEAGSSGHWLDQAMAVWVRHETHRPTPPPGRRGGSRTS